MTAQQFRQPAWYDSWGQAIFDRIAFPLFLLEIVCALLLQPFSKRDRIAGVLSKWG